MTRLRMHGDEDEVEVDAALVKCLVASQFPGLTDRRLEVVEPWGKLAALGLGAANTSTDRS